MRQRLSEYEHEIEVLKRKVPREVEPDGPFMTGREWAVVYGIFLGIASMIALLLV